MPQLRLGKRYSATLVDLEEEDTIASFVFTASMMIFYGHVVLWIFSYASSHRVGDSMGQQSREIV